MVVAAIDQRDADRRAGQTERRLQSAEAGADDHHAMGFCRCCLLGGHGPGAFGFRYLHTLDYVSIWAFGSKAVFLIARVKTYRDRSISGVSCEIRRFAASARR